jgi:hypothetical protein
LNQPHKGRDKLRFEAAPILQAILRWFWRSSSSGGGTPILTDSGFWSILHRFWWQNQCENQHQNWCQNWPLVTALTSPTDCIRHCSSRYMPMGRVSLHCACRIFDTRPDLP